MSDERILYDEMCRVLTGYEKTDSEEGTIVGDLYNILVKIRNRWEYVVTSGTGSRGVISDWLTGTGPFMCKMKGNHFTLMRVRKNENFDYLYIQRQYNGTGIERGDKFEYVGVYCRRNGLVYDCRHTARDLFDDADAQVARSTESLHKYLKSAVQSAVESDIGNDRNNLRIEELSSPEMSEDLTQFKKYSATGKARSAYLNNDNDGDNGDFEFTFRCHYRPEQWTEDSLLAYILDPDGYVRTEAKKYTDNHQELMLSDFLKGDMVAAEYKKFIENPSDPIHLVKRIIRAVSASSAKTVTVTIRKDNIDFTFKTEANEIRLDCVTHYSDWNIVMADRREFERLFGRGSHYKPEDILRIEYSRSVLYERG